MTVKISTIVDENRCIIDPGSKIKNDITDIMIDKKRRM
jgi:hypothetical protein